MRKIRRIGITTGDRDGVGLEVAIKALSGLGPQPGFQFFLFRSEKDAYPSPALLRRKFETITLTELPKASSVPSRSSVLVDLALPSDPAQWVESCAELCLSGFFSGMTTGPLSKPEILSSGRGDIGHTDILARLSRSGPLHMGFLGKYFNVVLATGHVPLKKVPSLIGADSVRRAIQSADYLRGLLPRKTRELPIGVLGLNPHAGDQGLLGQEESRFLEKFIGLNKSRYNLEGPLVPDAAFSPSSWHRYSLYLAMYHDQGLIPFKAFHSEIGGVHLTLGLPFIRTSVDHGTAKDIFKKNRARFTSMTRALSVAMTLIKNKES